MNLVPIPSLDELARDPAKAQGLPPEARQALTLRVAAVLAALAADPADGSAGRNSRPESTAEPDRLLTPEEAAALLGVTTRWIYRHAKRLPFIRRLSRKCLRASEAGLKKWQAAKRA